MTAQVLISKVYEAFNRKDADGVLAWMSEEVSWPKASEGGRVVGKQEIGEYWGRQWKHFDPQLEVLEVIEGEGGRVEVKVRQVVRTLGGEVLSESELWHVYGIRDSSIERMDIVEADGNRDGQSAAFAARGHQA